MRNISEQFPTVFINTSLGDTKEISFSSSLDCEGEVVIGKLYEIAGDEVKTVTGGSDLGVKKLKKITLTIDVSSVDAGSYGLKLYTVQTGVIGKSICVIR